VMTKRIKRHVFGLRSDVLPVCFSLDCFVQIDAPQCVRHALTEILTAINVKIAVF